MATSNIFGQTVCSAGQVTIDVTLMTDDFGREMTFEIQDAFGNPVPGTMQGPFASNATVMYRICLDASTCTPDFVLFDSFGDGFFFGEGNITVVANGETILNFGNDEDFSEIRVPIVAAGNDVTPPQSLCKDITVFLDDTGNASIVGADVDNGSNDNCAITSMSVMPNTFSCDNIADPNLVTLTNIDKAGNLSSCMAQVTVRDTIRPVFTCQDITVSLDASGMFSIPSANFIRDNIQTNFQDNCASSSVEFGITVSSWNCSNIGDNSTTISARDGNGNETPCTITVTVTDPLMTCNQPPVAVCQSVTVNADANCEAAVAAEAFDGGSTDPDMDILTFTVSPEGPYALGTTNVTLTVSDGMAMSQCMTTVTVEDNTPPVVTCQEFSANFSACSDAIFPNTHSGTFFPIGDLSDFSVAAGGIYVASFDLTTCVTDNCSGEGFQSAFVDSYEENRVAGCSVDIINVVTIRDAAGNQAADSIFFRFTITFDGDPPVITCPVGENIECGVIPTADATDASATSGCGTPDITVSDAVINGEPDMAGTTYTFTFTATDGCGKTSTCDQVFTVIDNTPPTIACFNQTINFNGETSIALDVADLVNATDNCGIQSISLSPNSISSNQVGQTVPVVVIVTDLNGNSAACTSQIAVTGLPPGWSQDANGVGCDDGNSIEYSAGDALWTATSTNCYYSSPFTSDELGFAQYTLCGNGSITAQVTGINGTSLGWAGVVMRETNASGAKKAQIMTNMSNFSRREFRTSTGGTAFPQQFPSQNRRWLRIIRSGNQFAMYVSPNGVNWAFAGAQNIQMNSCIEIGLVVSNYSANSTVTATFANVSVTGSNTLNDADESAAVNNDELKGESDFNIYPNPTSGELNVAFTGYSAGGVSLEVYSTMGQLLYIREIEEIQSTSEIIDLSSFPNGMYLIRVTSEGIPAAMKRVTLTR